MYHASTSPVGCCKMSVLVIEPVETYVYSYCIYWTIAYTESQIGRNITRNLLAIFVFADSLFELGVNPVISAYFP